MSGDWFACAEMMPDDGIAVMTFSPDSSDPVWPGFHGDDGWYDIMSGVLLSFPVTHWQHFPEPPL